MTVAVRWTMIVVAALVAPSYLLNACYASPFFSIGEGEWDQAIAAGSVVPVTSQDGLTGVEERFYNEQIEGIHDGVMLQTSTLIPDFDVTDEFGETRSGLVMAWPLLGGEGPGEDILDVAAFEIVYGDDPDLSGTTLVFEMLGPDGVWDISVELIDVNDNARGWMRIGDTPGFSSFSIDVDSSDPMQGDFELQADDPGFDITQVVAIRFDESGIWSEPFPVPDPTDTFPAGGWNVWVEVSVVPEPSSGMLGGFAIVCLLLYRVRSANR